MSAERTIDPLMKQHFAKIEDQVVVDTIASKMERLHKGDKQIYTRGTFIAEDSIMGSISEACANVYEPGLSHEDVWLRAEELAVTIVLDVATGLAATAAGEEYNSTQALGVDVMRAAFAMRAIDKIAPIDNQDDTPSQFNRLWDDSLPAAKYLDDIRYLARQSLRDSGVVVRAEGTDEVIPVADTITELEVSIENIEYQNLIERVQALSTISDYYDFQREIKDLTQSMLRLRTSKHITNDQFGAYLSAVENASRPGQFTTAATIFGLPHDYIASLYTEKEYGGEVIDRLIAEEAHRIKESNAVMRPRREFIIALRDYFPGGLSGSAAKENADMQTLRTAYEAGVYLYTETLPNIGTIYSPRQAREYNRISREVVKDVCNEMFAENPLFAEKQAENMLRAFTPRTYVRGQSHFDYNLFINAVTLACEHVDSFGAEAIEELSQSFDVGALDVMSPRQLETLINLTSGNRTAIKRLRSQDTSLIFFDAYGDHNGAIMMAIEQLDTSNPNIGQVVVPLRRMDDISNILTLLKQHNVKFCTLVLAHHGREGTGTVNKGSEAFTLVADGLKNTQTPVADLTGDSQYIPMRKLPLRRIVRDDMCMPKFATETLMPKEKRIIHVSCYSDVGSEVRKSIAETSLTSVGKRAIVMGVSDVATISRQDRNGSGLRIFGPERGIQKNEDTKHSTNVVVLKGRSRVEWIQVNGKLRKRRITTPKRTKFNGRIIA